MLATIGYARLPLARMDALLADLAAILCDVRSRPWSRIPGYGRTALEGRYGERYVWRGDVLGGGPNVTRDRTPADIWPSGLPWLARERRPLLLLCLEEAPWECHRHLVALGVPRRRVLHLYRDQMIDARELERAFKENDGYEYRPMPHL